MCLTWCVFALALAGADDSQPTKPEIPSSPFTIEITINGPQAQATACQKVVADTTATPPASVKPSDPFAGCPKAELPGHTVPIPLPKVAKPRTINDSEAQETWPMTLEQAVRIGLDNSEIVRVISFGAQGIPIGGFEPTPLKTEIGPDVVSGLVSSILEGATGLTLPGRSTAPPVVPKANSAPIVIARLNADTSIWRFEAEVMAHVRSVEQQYWNLAHAHAALWSVERAVSMAQEILDREEAELTRSGGHGTIGYFAEASERLEQFRLDLVTRKSDVITTERQLRNILGLPQADNRRIIPVTPATEQRITFDWDTCLSEMMQEQPDVVQQETLVRLAELQLMLARHQMILPLTLNTLYQLSGLGQELNGPEAMSLPVIRKALNPKVLPGLIASTECCAGLAAAQGDDKDSSAWQVALTYGALPHSVTGYGGRGPLVNTRHGQYMLLRERARKRQVVHQTTHSLARFFLEVDANYKQYQTASRLRAAAAQRIDAQRAFYEEGRITVDRFLDSISQFATAIATESQYLATYNISLTALSEAKGTLLADRNIVVAEGPRPAKSWQVAHTKTDDQAKMASFEPAKSEPAKSTSSEAKPNTWTFSISVGGAAPVRITGTYSRGGQPEPAKTAE